MSEVRVAENGSRRSVSLGERIVLELPENATTGDRWRVAQVPAALDVVENVFSPPASTARGARGHRRVVLVALEKGEGTTILRLERAWESDDPPADEFRFDVVVQ